MFEGQNILRNFSMDDDIKMFPKFTHKYYGIW